jgi:CheY-like chemotaxis protein
LPFVSRLPPSILNLWRKLVQFLPDARELLKRMLEMGWSPRFPLRDPPKKQSNTFSLRGLLFLCDIGMPGEDGYSLIRQLQLLEEDQQNPLPAVALTAYARSEAA